MHSVLSKNTVLISKFVSVVPSIVFSQQFKMKIPMKTLMKMLGEKKTAVARFGDSGNVFQPGSWKSRQFLLKHMCLISRSTAKIIK